MSAPPFHKSPLLSVAGISHGFFSREGGVSEGVFSSLNTGPGSADRPENIAENRRRCALALSADPEQLLTNYQIHSATVVTVDCPRDGGPPQADAHVTNVPGLTLGVLTADCMPWLFVDPQAKVIGAAHAGWRGALAGILENTVESMAALGAEPANICAALGPCMRQPNFEVGLDLVNAFTQKHPESERFFAPGKAEHKRMFDLAGFGAWRLRKAGVEKLDDLDICTLDDPDRYFSYRASRRAGDSDYGRNLSAIVID